MDLGSRFPTSVISRQQASPPHTQTVVTVWLFVFLKKNCLIAEVIAAAAPAATESKEPVDKSMKMMKSALNSMLDKLKIKIDITEKVFPSSSSSWLRWLLIIGGMYSTLGTGGQV